MSRIVSKLSKLYRLSFLKIKRDTGGLFMPKLKNKSLYNKKRRHLFDNYKHLGYNYHSNILKNVASNELFGNPLTDIPMRQIERMIESLIDTAKQIKLHFNFTLDKDSILQK